MINQKNKKSRHEEILESATELLSLRPTATLQEIADYANIGIATLHRHFSSREALLNELAINAIHLVENALQDMSFQPEEMEKALEELFLRLIPLGDKIYFLAYAASVDEDPRVSEKESQLKKPLADAIENWKQAGLLNPSIPVQWMVTVIYNLLFGIWQEIHSGNLAKNDAARLLLTTVLQGFQPAHLQP